MKTAQTNIPLRLLAALPLLLASLPAQAAEPDDASGDEKTTSMGKQYEGIVRVECSAITPDFRAPWNPAVPSGGSGTAFMIAPNLFMTNAHVVSNASRLTIKKVGDATPYSARIKFIANDCDLALLELKNPSAFAKVIPWQIGKEIPKLDTTVRVVGYPLGSERISVTRGVVSRIDFVPYSHSGVDRHLAVQVDAAINPGNSGGPVIQDGKVTGVAFQGMDSSVAQNIAHMIPVPVIRRFLKDVEDGTYDYYVDLAASQFPLINPGQRKALGLPDNGLGIMVSTVDETGSSGGVLQPGDVLLAIDGRPIGSNGFIDLDGEQVDMEEIVERKFAGDKVKFKLWRDRKEMEVEIELKRFLLYLMAARQYDVRPRYVMFAGLVFQPLDYNLMLAHGIANPKVRYYFNYFVTHELHKERPEVVVLTSILPDAINTHFQPYEQNVVDEINGVKIKGIKDVSAALTKETEGSHVIIKLEGEGRPIVLEKSKIAAAQKRIMEQYGIEEAAFIEKSE